LEFPEEMQEQIPKEQVLVYYHSGDCSLCYGNLMAISKEFPDLKLLSISTSQDTTLVNYYLDNIGFKGTSLIDSALVFQNINKKLLSTENLFLIDSEFNIVVSGKDFNDNIRKKIRDKLNI
jgi:hypothetical protein